MNILVVEDSKPVSLVISRVIEELGHQYVLAADGETALRLFEQRDIDLLIIDVELPGPDGFAIAREVRRNHAKLPIMVISGNSSEDYRQQSEQAGADLFVSKPLRPSQLRAHLSHLCGNSSTSMG